MDNVMERTPTHVWIVGGLATLWNLVGVTGYLAARMHNVDLMRRMGSKVDPEVALAYADAMPIWASFGWGLGVWTGLLGSVLLLLRNRYAVHAFALSLVGVVLSFSYQFFVTPPPPGMDDKVMPAVIIVIAIALFLYARAMQAKGVLR